MDKKQQHKLKAFIKNLEKVRGRHTELVSVYVPAGYDLNKIIGHIKEEQGTASNIKDKTTRNNVIDSLERIIRHLRLFKKTPDNGLAIFAGNFSDKESQTDIQVHSIEPSEPLNFRLYRCDQTFVLDALKDMLDVHDTYGLLVIDNREANVGTLRGTVINQITHMTSGVPGKTRAGGQCINQESLVQLSNGNILEIKNVHNPNIVKNFSIQGNVFKDSPVIEKWEAKKYKSYTIITKYPRLEIESSKDHVFFVFNNGIKEKAAEELKEDDYLLMPEKIDIDGNIQNLSNNHYNFYTIKKSGIKYLINKRIKLGLSQEQLQKIISVARVH